MRTLLFALLLIAPISAFSQFFGINASYIYDGELSASWRSSRGVQFGAGLENYRFEGTPLLFSYRFTSAFTKSRFNSVLDNIEFDLPDSLAADPMGFAEVDYKKFSFGIEFDLGYQQWEESVLEPYVTVGAKFDNYLSSLRYELYNPDSCQCYDTSSKPFTETKSIGFTSGIGLKIKPFENFFFDLRATYYGNWSMKSNDVMERPDTDSFHIDNYGNPGFNYPNAHYFHGMNFRVGVIFRIRIDTDNIDFNLFDFDSDDDNDDDDDRDYDSDDNDNDCTPISLSPSGRG